MVRNKTRFMVPCLSRLAPALLPSQETGSLRITVTDPSGGIVPDAQILLSDEFNGTRRIAAVDNDPSFCLVNGLDPGIYPLQVTKAGFDAYIVEKLRIHAREGQVVRIPLRLASAATQAITVTGEIEGVSSEPSAGTTVDGKYLSDLPVNSRGFENLLTLSRGVTNAGDGPDGGIHANGLRSNTNYYMVDGVSANTGVGGGGPALPAGPGGPGGFGGSGANGTGVATNASGSSSGLISLDAVKELQVQVSAFAPEFGRSPGAQISITSRGGTNELHASASGFYRNTSFNANDWFNSQNRLGRGTERLADTALTAGGPVQKNKTFFSRRIS